MAIAIDLTVGGYSRTSSANGTSTTSIAATKPANVVSGDLLIAILQCRSTANPNTMAAPAGWTVEFENNSGNSLYKLSTLIAWKIAGGSEPSTYDFTFAADTGQETVYIQRITGADTTTPFDVVASANDGQFVASPVGNSVTTVTNGAMLLHVCGSRSGSGFTAGSGYPAGTTGIYKEQIPTNTNLCVALAYESFPTAGATGTRTWASYNSSSQYATTATIAIRPATGPSITLPIDGDNAVTQGQTGVRLIQTNCTGTVASVTVGGASATPSLDTSNLSPWFIADFGNLSVDAAVSATGTPSGNFPASTYATFEAGYGAQRSVAQAYPGSSTSLQLSIPTGSDGDNNGGGTGDPYGLFGLKITLPASVGNGGVVHAQIRQFFPTGFQLTSTQALKWLRFNTKDGAQASQGYNDLYIQPADTGTWSSPNVNPLDGGYDGSAERQLSFVSEGRTNHFWTNNTVDLNTWNEIEFEVGLGAAGTGWAKVWKKVAGTWTLIGSFTGISTLSNAAHTCDSFFVHTYWNGNSPATQSVFIDRVVVHNNLGDMIEVDGAGNAIIAGSVNA